MPDNSKNINDANRYVEEARRMDESEGDVLSVEDIDLLHVPTEATYKVSRLADYSGITFFSLGPLYVALNISFNILETFAVDTGIGAFERHTLYFSHPIIAGLGDWSFILEGIPDAVAATLFQYLDTQTVLIRHSSIYSTFMRRDVAIADPYGVDRKDLLPGEDPTRIVVYVPSTNHCRVDLMDPPPGPPPISLRVQQWPPVLEVVTEGNAALNKRLEI